MRITKRDKVRVPWLELAKTPTKYLDVNTIPEGFKMLDPSKFTKNMTSDLWDHWSKRAKAKLPILIFIEAREQDLGLRARYQWEKPLVNRKRVAYVDVGSDDQASDDELDDHVGKSKDGVDKGKGTLGSPVRPPPSKRPRLSRQPPAPQEQSPAANDSDRPRFLYSLSLEPSYKTLLDGMLALPVSVSLLFFIYINLSNYTYI